MSLTKMIRDPSAGQDPGLPAHELVYRRLRAMVLFGELQPGQAVTIQGLVAQLDAGMTPVREALRRLTAEHALEAQGNRRITVPVLSAQDLDELREARLALEPGLAVRAMARITAQDLANLKAIDTRLDQTIALGDVPGYLYENYSFHKELNLLSEAPILTGLTESLWLRFGPSLRVVCGVLGTRNLPDRHKDLLAAYEAKDVSAVRQAMADDVLQGMDLVIQSLPSAAD